MSPSTAIAIRNDVLRYATVEKTEDAPEIKAVGRHTFEEDEEPVLFGGAEEEVVEERRAALVDVVGEIMDGAGRRPLGVAVPPPEVYSFFTPIPPDASPRERERWLAQRVALLVGEQAGRQAHSTSTTVRQGESKTGEPVTWMHVLVVPDPVEARMEAVVDALPVDGHVWTVTPEAAAYAGTALEAPGEAEQEAQGSFALAVGQYATHTEFSLLRGQQWYHAQYTEEVDPPANQVYFALGFLNRMDVSPEAIGRVVTYGECVDAASVRPYEEVLDRTPEPLDPAEARFVLKGEEAFGPGEDGTAYVPCVGAALKGAMTEAIQG